MRPLLGCWREVVSRFQSSPALALFLDFDGTLTPIRPRPELVRVHPAVRRVLAALAARQRCRVWVISARRRDDVRSRLRVPGVHYLGLYGWERGPAVLSPDDPIAEVKALLKCAAPAHPGLWIEDKRQIVAVHYRACAEPVRKLAAEYLRRAVEPWGDLLRVAPGKCVWEVLPRDWGDKGAAVRRELAALRRSVLPIYVGDDLSDEPAFAAASSGITVRVGPRRSTLAHYRVNRPADVLQFLERLRAEIL